MTEITPTEMAKAMRNEAYGEFVLENPETGKSKTFKLKHLSYDAYVEFCDLARPILTSLAGAIDMNAETGELKLDFNPQKLDFGELLRICGKELPRMAWLCCKQSEPKITIEEVKELGHRPQILLSVVLKQIKHNEMVKEFSDFFQSLAGDLKALLPEATEAMMPTPMTEVTES